AAALGLEIDAVDRPVVDRAELGGLAGKRVGGRSRGRRRRGGRRRGGGRGGEGRGDRERERRERVHGGYLRISSGLNQRLTSRAASDGSEDAWMTFSNCPAVVMRPKEPRIVPGAACSGFVAPAISRTRLIALSPR